MLSQEMVSKLLDIAKDGSIVMGKQLDGLSTQLVNYFIFITALDIGQHLLVGVVAYILVKIITTAVWAREKKVELLPTTFKNEEEAQEAKIKKAGIQLEAVGFRYITYAIILGSGFYILANIITPLRSIGKLVFAPNIFLIEKAAELVKTGEFSNLTKK